MAKGKEFWRGLFSHHYLSAVRRGEGAPQKILNFVQKYVDKYNNNTYSKITINIRKTKEVQKMAASHI